MYEEIGEQISLAREKRQKILLLGDFNCKIGDRINGNRIGRVHKYAAQKWTLRKVPKLTFGDKILPGLHFFIKF